MDHLISQFDGPEPGWGGWVCKLEAVSGTLSADFIWEKRAKERAGAHKKIGFSFHSLGTGKAHVVSARKLSVVDVAREPPHRHPLVLSGCRL